VAMASMKNRRTVNFRSDITRGRTINLEARLLAELADEPEGMTMRELGDELGIGRVDAAYHCKRLAAEGSLKLELEPCEENSGLRLRAWDPAHLARKVAGRFSRINELKPGLRSVRAG
jgi:DNA-binding Lrp family transcriptional regulator